MSFKAIFSESIMLMRALVRNQWLLLGLLFFIGALINISIEDTVGNLPRGQEDSRWIYQLAMGLWDLFEGLASLLILSAGVSNVCQLSARHFLSQPFSGPYLGSFFAEYLRALAQILLWGLLFLVPGFLRYCRLIFVPMITLFSKDYREGKEDALELSNRISHGRMNLILPMVIATAAAQGLLEMVPNMIPDLHILILRVGFSLISFFIGIWTYSFLFLIFEDGINRLNT
jgi:hypothetical protein